MNWQLIDNFMIFNSSGTFLSASEDQTGILRAIEEKIAKVTMLPTTHGEVTFIMTVLILNSLLLLHGGVKELWG